MGALFGGSKQKSSSTNQAYPQISQQFSGVADSTGQSQNALASLLGLGGDTGQTQAFQNFRNSTGYNQQMDQGQRAVTGSAAARGLLQSGSTGKALNTFGQGLASSSLNDYISQLFNFGNVGLQAGGLISGAGQQSQGSGSSKPGISKFLGAAAAGAAASDRRLKDNIEIVGKTDSGLHLYEWDYRQDNDFDLPLGRFTGVMADEVAQIIPDALGPLLGDKYMTVDYSKIGVRYGRA